MTVCPLSGRGQGHVSNFYIFDVAMQCECAFRHFIGVSSMQFKHYYTCNGWLGSRVVSVLALGAVGPGFKSQPRRARVTVLGKLFTPIVPLFIKQQNGSSPLKGCGGGGN